jgi:hypothetical protein
VALIAFHRLHGNHDGKTLAITILHLLDRAGVTVKVRAQILEVNGTLITYLVPFKVGHFTLDNAANNETMMYELQRRLQEREIVFDAADRKVMCYAHIVNLSSGRVIAGLTKVAIDSDADWSGPPLPYSPTEQTYDEAIARDPISLGRTVVRIIRASGTRRDAFDDVVATGNTKGWFKQGRPPNEKTVRLKQLQLLRDVRTRWDSVYYMLNRLREMRPVCHPS